MTPSLDMTSIDIDQAVRRAHYVTGQWLFVINRLLFGFVALGLVFTMGYMPLANVVENPEVQLQAQAFQINYYEMVKSRQDEVVATDPDWDGALAGMSTGYTMTRDLPFVLPMMGAVIGAVIGFQLDSKI